MPSRKRSNLSQYSKNAKRLRHVRSQEPDNEREARLASERQRFTDSISLETSARREFRLENIRHLNVRYRSSETFTQRESRLNTDSLRHAELRASETFTEHESRLTADSQRHADSRASETFTERESRLSADSQRHAESRASETFTDRQSRLTADSQRHAESRASESFSEHQSRLTADSQRHAESRASETFTDRQSRLTADSQRHAESRASETFTQRQSRLTADSQRHAESRASESFSEHQSRLTADSKRHAESRASETFTDRQSRLTADSQRHAESRASETFTQRQSRLTADSQRLAESRASETFTQRELRLMADSRRHADSRASETFTQYEARLTGDSQRHAQSRLYETFTQHEERMESARDSYDRRRQGRSSVLSSERERISGIRHTQTQEQRESRLNEDRILRSLNRMSISSEDSIVSEELPWIDKVRSGFSYSSHINYAEFADTGRMIQVCAHCQALKWRKESNGLCCSGGKVRLDIFQEPPELIRSLLNGEHPQSKHFLQNIRSYNSAFQMTSFGANEIAEGNFMPTFKVQGQVYHLIGSILPVNEPKFLQIYFVSDYCEQVNIRNRIFPNLNTSVVTEVQNILHATNPYINNFKAAIETIPEGQQNNFKLVISADRRPSEDHRGRYNAPTTNEVAAVLIDQECDRRDIILRTRDDRLQRISETHRAYDALQYPLIYCRGEDGYNFGLYHINPVTGDPNYNKKISALQFYCFVLQIRQDHFTHLQRFRALFSQFVVDMYAKIETERLVYIRTNQRRLRAESYVDLRDAMQQDTNTENLGRLVILPSSFTGGPRYMHERTQDAFCYVRKYGRPDLFITFTTNPKWTEITQELFQGQASHDRHDIVARVFHLKLKLMIGLLTKENVFGAALCFMYSVEWQKRGLPHAHILLWLQEKVRPSDVDNIISAEIPDPNEDADLYSIVKTHMVHGPCGALNRNSPCMRDGRCTKRFPKTPVDQTVTGEDGYPSYRRRLPLRGGFTAQIRLRGHEVILDNRWVVPYSPVLLKTFKAHINVEMCNSVESIKYICKYINKGSDQATFAVNSNNRDEVTRYQSGRYISSSEAVWRIFSFPIHERYPPVTHLDVHLEGGQRIYFDPENVGERLENPRQTTLLAFFRLCETDDFAKTLLYEEVPAFYTFNKQQGIFNRRRRGAVIEGYPGVFKEHNLGRVYTVHPNNTELYYLRLLLYTVRGPTSFSALRTINGVEHPTFMAACRERHLLDDDQHWDDTLAEACVSDNPRRLRHLFSMMLVFCGLSHAAQLWEKYKHALAEDFLRHDHGLDASVIFCLKAIQDAVFSIGGNPLLSYGLPESTATSNGEQRGNRELLSETSYDSAQITETLRDGIPRLTDEQRSVFERVCDSTTNNSGQMFFLDAPGGTGKTFLTKIILAQIRSQSKIALAVASSGIAATLLPGGKTAHAMFKIPLQLDNIQTPVCDISRNSDKAQVLRDCCLIVWDECTMAHRKAVEAVNRTVQDIRQNERTMGGITMLFCGDFRQILPVVPRGTRADEVNACLKSSSLWSHIIQLHLTINMRARRGGNINAQEFSDLLLKIGNDTFPKEEGKVRLPLNLCQTVSSSEELIPSVYGDIAELPNRTNSWLCERAILTTRNDRAATINSTILMRVHGENVEYNSINRVMEDGDATTYPIEFLNSLSAPGLPSHVIHLKVGVPIILLRNLSPPILCNGTRLKVTALQQNIIEAEVLIGCGEGEHVFIPRIPLIPNNFPFRFKRVQFPVSVCFAMTINKAQGQTLCTAGVDLTTSCFSHGQLYVALSRVSSATNIFTYASDNLTDNIVYSEAL